MPDPESPIRRILVALDASPASRFAIRTGVDLATRFGAQLVGLFVEDINLLRVARLPFVREVGSFSPAVRRLDPQDLERQLRRQADQMRRSLALAADPQGIPWSFHVKRGPVAVEVMTAGADADLMIMGRVGRSLLAHRRLGSTTRAMVLQRPGLLFILTREVPISAGATVLYDGSPAGRKALQIAIPLGTAANRRLTVVLVAESREEAADLREEVLQHLSGFAVEPEIRVLLQPSHQALAWMVRLSGEGPVVLPCGKKRLEGEKLCSLVDAVSNPVLIVR